MLAKLRSPLPRYGTMTIANVLTFPPPIINVRKYWLNETTNAIENAESMTGNRFGSVTLKNAWSAPAPRTLACSSSFTPIALVPSCISVTAYGREQIRWTIMTPWTVPLNPHLIKVIWTPIANTVPGTRNGSIDINENSRFPKKS